MDDSNTSHQFSIVQSWSESERIIELTQHRAIWLGQGFLDHRSPEVLVWVSIIWVAAWRGYWVCFQPQPLRPSFFYTLTKVLAVHFFLSKLSILCLQSRTNLQEVGLSSVLWVKFCFWCKFPPSHDFLTPMSPCFGRDWCNNPAHLRSGQFILVGAQRHLKS